jgi:hypothetical protein
MTATRVHLLATFDRTDTATNWGVTPVGGCFMSVRRLLGYILWQLKPLPSEGHDLPVDKHPLELVSMDERVVNRVQIRQRQGAD